MINWALKPLSEEPSNIGKKISRGYEELATPNQTERTFDPNSFLGNYEDYANKFNAQVRGGISGMMEGVGDYASGMTSPLALAGSAIGISPWLRGAKELTGLGRMTPPRVSPVGPSISEIPKEWLGVGMEEAYNATKQLPRLGKTVEDLAYEVVRNRDKGSIGRNLVLDNMQRVQAARGNR